MIDPVVLAASKKLNGELSILKHLLRENTTKANLVWKSLNVQRQVDRMNYLTRPPPVNEGEMKNDERDRE